MSKGLFYYKLVSPYPEDVTKNCKLTINEIDHDLKTLKDVDIKTAEFVRGEDCEKSAGTLVITRNNGDKIIVPIDTTVCNNFAFDLKTNVEECKSGATLTITYKDKDESGNTRENSTILENIITADNLIDVIGSDVLTKVITDNTLKGLGTMDSPLGLAGVEKTGMLAPAIKMLDLTDGSKLPEVAKKGTRYVTREYVSDYGYLYNGAGVKKISDLLDIEYQRNQIFKEVERNYYWRVSTKADWDKMLNSIEPCEFKNHNSANCHAELGKYAGAYLKSECGWTWQPDCKCDGTKPNTGCTYYTGSTEDDDDYINDSVYNETPDTKPVSPIGIDKYGMRILPAGVGSYVNSQPRFDLFKESAVFWTTTHIYNDLGQDIYLKKFDYDKSGVYQLAECPDPYYSVRLVKDYDGSNYREIEYIDGVPYKAILFPESRQIWLASNFANTTGFVGYKNGSKPEYLIPNGGEGISDRRIEMFINEYNGEYWEKKVMEEGITIVIENPCFDKADDIEEEVCWKDETGETHCVTVVIPKVSQHNIEYRVYFDTEEGKECDKILVNTDDLVVERILNIIIPMLEKERFERIEADEALNDLINAEIDRAKQVEQELWDGINKEYERATSAETELWEAINKEASARTEADEALSDAIETERNERIESDKNLQTQISDEISARTQADDELWDALNAETENRINADAVLEETIEAETGRAISAETALNERIDAETERATVREDEIEEELIEEIERAKAAENDIDGQLVDTSKNPYSISLHAPEGEYNLIIESKDGNEEHFIKMKLNADFGTF